MVRWKATVETRPTATKIELRRILWFSTRWTANEAVSIGHRDGAMGHYHDFGIAFLFN